jgi:ferric-dicitrate binding protein FerR (iron transport regulator)
MTSRPADLARRSPALALILLLPGCSTWKSLRHPVAEAVTAPEPTERVRIQLRDGARLELEIREVTADSLHGWATGASANPKLDPPGAPHGRPLAVALADIAKIESWQKDAVLTALLVLGIAGAVAAAAGIAAIATMGSVLSYQP